MCTSPFEQRNEQTHKEKLFGLLYFNDRSLPTKTKIRPASYRMIQKHEKEWLNDLVWIEFIKGFCMGAGNIPLNVRYQL